MRIQKGIALEGLNRELLQLNRERKSDRHWVRIFALKAYRDVLIKAYGQSQCTNNFCLLSSANLELVHVPAKTYFYVGEIEAMQVNDEYATRSHEFSWSIDEFPYGDQYSELISIELALLDAMSTYYQYGGTISQNAGGKSGEPPIGSIMQLYD